MGAPATRVSTIIMKRGIACLPSVRNHWVPGPETRDAAYARI